ncbi:MAG: hypothetical protein ACYC0V_15180 [Armatimonadota bacterium]
MKQTKLTLLLIITSFICCRSAFTAENGEVSLVHSATRSFVIKTGAYVVSYKPSKSNDGWIVIGRNGVSNSVITTKLANGAEFNPTDIGDANVYGWIDPRKDSQILKSINATEMSDKIVVQFNSERRWAFMTSQLTAYKRYPGLLNWNVRIKAKSDKTFNVDPEPDCRFMTASLPESGGSYWGGTSDAPHDVIRYMTQRGPATGIAYFNDLSMKSSVFYLQDYTSLNDLYRLTGFANPFDYPSEGQAGSVKMGKPWHDFQDSLVNGVVQHAKPFASTVDSLWRFGYERPFGFRVPKGAEFTAVDTYLYLKPDPQKDSISVCKSFVETLASIYRYIKKPAIVETDWVGDVVPRLMKDLMREPNISHLNEKNQFPRAYVSYEHKDYQLWTLAQLLHPLIEYVKKYPQHKEAIEIKQHLEESLPLFYDKDFKGFNNNLPPLNQKMYFHSVYTFIPVMMIADIALLGNKDAKEMISGYRPRLLDMGRKTGYVFADMWLEDYSKQSGYYQFDETGAYVYLMMALYELSGNKDAEALDNAKAAAEKLLGRCMDLGWQVNITATGAVGCEKLYKVTGDTRYRDIAYIPLANTLRQAWLWECDYGVGEKTTTFWAFCGTPAATSSAEFETHRTRLHLKQYQELAKAHLTPEVNAMLSDSWQMGPMQSRFTLPPYMKAAGASKYIAAEGKYETDCGEIRYDQMIPLEDVRVGWCTDLEWWNNNAKLGVVGQEIYGAGGMIWYAVWQNLLESQKMTD